jgi:hypothetical protein
MDYKMSEDERSWEDELVKQNTLRLSTVLMRQQAKMITRNTHTDPMRRLVTVESKASKSKRGSTSNS